MAPGYFVLGRTAIDNDWKTWPAILPSLSNTARCTIVFFSKDRISSTVWRPCIWPSRRSSYATNDVEQQIVVARRHLAIHDDFILEARRRAQKPVCRRGAIYDRRCLLRRREPVLGEHLLDVLRGDARLDGRVADLRETKPACDIGVARRISHLGNGRGLGRRSGQRLEIGSALPDLLSLDVRDQLRRRARRLRRAIVGEVNQLERVGQFGAALIARGGVLRQAAIHYVGEGAGDVVSQGV